MNPIAILEHNKSVPVGYLGEALAASGLSSFVVRLHADELLPELGSFSALISLGGIMGAYDEDKFSFLAAEKVLLRKAVEAEVPVLGICLGCQMLADALGGSAYKAESHELEFCGLDVAPIAAADPVLGPLAEPVVLFHGDTWDPPPAADVVVKSDRFNHAFRMGSAVAIQAHPEASASIAARWVESHGRDNLIAAGNDPDGFLVKVGDGEDANRDRALRLFGAWLAEVAESVETSSQNREA